MPRPRSTANPLDAIEADASSRSFLPFSRPDPCQRSSARARNRLCRIRRSTTSSTLLSLLHPPSSRPVVCTAANLYTWADRRRESLAARLCRENHDRTRVRELETSFPKLLFISDARRKRGRKRKRQFYIVIYIKLHI